MSKAYPLILFLSVHFNAHHFLFAKEPKKHYKSPYENRIFVSNILFAHKYSFLIKEKSGAIYQVSHSRAVTWTSQ